MKVLLMSQNGKGLGIAHQLVKEGHTVRAFLRNPDDKSSGLGWLERVDSWRPVLDDTELVLIDGPGFGSLEKTFRRFGRPFLGGFEIEDLLANNPWERISTLIECGLLTPDSWLLLPEEARELAWEEPGFRVIADKQYICDKEELYKWVLDRLDSETEVVIQRLVEGESITCVGWWNGRAWLDPFSITLSGDPVPGLEVVPGTITHWVERNSRLVEETQLRLLPFLKERTYRGPISIPCVINDEGIYATSLDLGLHFEGIEALIETMRGSVLDFFFELAVGYAKELDIRGNWGASTALCSAKAEQEVPILGLNEENLKHIYYKGVFLEEEKTLSSGGSPILLEVCARGQSISQATGRINRTLEYLSSMWYTASKQWHSKVSVSIDKLRSAGFLGNNNA